MHSLGEEGDHTEHKQGDDDQQVGQRQTVEESNVGLGVGGRRPVGLPLPRVIVAIEQRRVLKDIALGEGRKSCH